MKGSKCMFWKRIVLDGYIPFTHVGNKHVEIDFVSPVTSIAGANGCGKSSLLRIMDVAHPPIRTDFQKEGRIEMTLEHDGHTFVLTSDFKNSSAPHSFKKDGVELNISGTSDTQSDLAYEHFGITPLINELMAGNIHICATQKAARKQFFSATYPSDLSFVLEYHKKVCSQIRVLSNQIKLLQGREGSLLASIMSQSEVDKLNMWRDTALEIVTKIDRINLLLSNEVEQLSKHPVLSKKYDDSRLDNIEEDLQKLVVDYRSKLLDVKSGSKYGERVDKDLLRLNIERRKQQLEFFSSQLEKDKSSVSSVVEELNKLEKLRDTPTSDKKDDIINELHLIEKEMEEIKSKPEWQDAPSIHEDKLEIVNDLVSTINDIIVTIHPYSGKLIGQDEINRLRSESDGLRFTTSNLITEQTSLESQFRQMKSRKDMLTQNSYPKDCDRVCGLRATLDASVRDIDLRCKDIETRLEHITEDLIQQRKQIETNQRILQEVSPVLPIMKRLWDILSENYLIDLALNGETFLDCLNTQCYEIGNRIVKGIESSKLFFRYKKLSEQVLSIKNMLTAMEANESAKLSADMINEMIRDRQSKLDAGIAEIDRIERSQNKILDEVNDMTFTLDTMKNIETIIGYTTDVLNSKILLNRIAFDKQLIAEHDNVRNVLTTKLREIEGTLSEQRRISDILNTEIRPTLDTLRKQLANWSLVESGLSPTCGLPCVYLIRFINRLIARTNELISAIWYCDMELAYLDEKDNLDFTLKLILNRSTTVKDVSLCSNGQKAVIDLCFTLAVAMERGYINWMTLRMDETDAALTDEHRAKLIDLISRYISDGAIRQLMIVSHFAAQTGLPDCDNVVLCTDGIVCPATYNEHAVIE